MKYLSYKFHLFQASGDDWFDQMYYGSNGNGLNFARDEYYYSVRSVLYGNSDSEFYVVGSMGTTHKVMRNSIAHMNILCNQ